MDNRLAMNNRRRNIPDELLGKMPPQDKAIEESILGLCLQDMVYYRRASTIIRNAEAFYYDDHKSVWHAMQQLDKENVQFDMMVVADKLHRAGFPGAVPMIARLSAQAVFASQLESQCFIVAEYYIRRACITLSQQWQQQMFDTTLDVFTSLDELKLSLDAVTDNLIKNAIADGKTVAMEAIRELQIRMSQPDIFLGLPLPVKELYNATYGLIAPDLWVLAARPAMGKTAVALAFLFEVLIADNPAAMFSLEMSKVQIMKRMICLGARRLHNARLSNHELRGRVTPQQYQHAERAAAVICEKQLYIDDTAGISLSELKSKCVQLKTRYGVKFIVIDYLQLITNPAGTREQEISQIARTLKNLAKELDIPILALSQLSRSVDSRTNKRPGLADLRESGEIEQAADQVVFLYRPEYYGETTDENGQPTQGLLEFIVAKQRNGATGTTPAYFEPATGLVDDWDKKPDLFSQNAAIEFDY